MSEKYIFVSYSRKDKRTVNKVVEILKEKGIPVWIDVSGIESGDQFKYIIVSAIERCEAVLYFASENSNASHWTAKEIGIATSLKKRIIPIKLDESEFNKEILFDLVNLNYIDLAHAENLTEGVAPLIDTLKKIIPDSAAKPVAENESTQKDSRIKAFLKKVFQPKNVFVLASVFIAFCAVFFYSPMGRLLIHRLMHMVERDQKVQLIPAERGYIFDADNDTIAANAVLYDVHLDPCFVTDSIWQSGSRELSQGLASVLPEKTAPQWWGYLRDARQQEKNCVLIAKDVKLDVIKSLRRLAIFQGTFRNALIIQGKTVRIYPYGNLARRTIGHVTDVSEDPLFGLECRYDTLLRGVSGVRRYEEIRRMGKVRTKDLEKHDVLNGYNLYTTLEMERQAVADSVLRMAMSSNENIVGGCFVLMEVNSGHIEALANIHRLDDGSVGEYFDYSVDYFYDSGAFGQMMILTAAIADGVVTSLDDRFLTRHGILTDSSAVALLSQEYLGASDYLHDWVELFSITSADYKMMQPDNVGHASIPAILCPIQLLAFYNAVANDGKMMAPGLIAKIDDVLFPPVEIETRSVRPDVAEMVWRLLQQESAQTFTESNIVEMHDVVHSLWGNNDEDRQLQYAVTSIGCYPANSPRHSALCLLVTDRTVEESTVENISGKVLKDVLTSLQLDR